MACAERLKRNRDFSRVYRQGVYHNGRWIGLHAYRRRGKGLEYPTRVGFTVSRVIRGAVHRNRAKRLLREAFRLSAAEVNKGYDLIMTARWRADQEPALNLLISETNQLLIRSGAGRND